MKPVLTASLFASPKSKIILCLWNKHPGAGLRRFQRFISGSTLNNRLAMNFWAVGAPSNWRCDVCTKCKVPHLFQTSQTANRQARKGMMIIIIKSRGQVNNDWTAVIAFRHGRFVLLTGRVHKERPKYLYEYSSGRLVQVWSSSVTRTSVYHIMCISVCHTTIIFSLSEDEYSTSLRYPNVG